MANLMDTEAGSELFASYEAELDLIQAELTQKVERIAELAGEPRKSAIRAAENTLEEANEVLDQMRIEKQNIPAPTRTKTNQRFRSLESDVARLKRRLDTLSSDRAALLGFSAAAANNNNSTSGPFSLSSANAANPYDSAFLDDARNADQRNYLLTGAAQLERSSDKLENSCRTALETEDIGRSTLAALAGQRETITRTRDNLLDSEGYADRSIKTLRGMGRRMVTNRIITVSIIAVLVLLILAVVISKFR